MLTVILFYKLMYIAIFGVIYLYLHKRIIRLEEKLVFMYFFIFFYVGGAISSLIFPFKGTIFINSSMKDIEPSILLWSAYFLIVFLIPCLCLLIFKKIFNDAHTLPITTTKYSLLIIQIAFLVIFIIFNVDISTVTNSMNSIRSYTDWVLYRAELQHSGLFYFVLKPVAFVILLSLPIEAYLKNSKKLSLILFITGLSVFGIIEHCLFATKGLLSNYAVGYLFFLFIHMELKVFIPIALPSALSFIVYYAYNMGAFYEYQLSSVFFPLIAGITRFTLAIPYFISYYLEFGHDYKVYFSNQIFGQVIVSPNIKVYPYALDTVRESSQITGSLTGGMFVYNYSNFGAFAIIQSCFEFTILILLYKYVIVRGEMTSAKLALLCFMMFNLMNFEFTTVFVNPVSGIAYFVMIYLVGCILKSCKKAYSNTVLTTCKITKI